MEEKRQVDIPSADPEPIDLYCVLVANSSMARCVDYWLGRYFDTVYIHRIAGVF